MASSEEGEKDYENNKDLFYNRISDDGKLVSPIDLSLENVQQLTLDKLKWVNIEDAPIRMKLTNTGETVIVSAKWVRERPYLTGGPLRDSYVFSQIHFHWGSDEREGSEHTVRGICYPMEMHVVFYKTRYLTQEAALKNDDGLIIVVYLIKLGKPTTPGLSWLVSHLDRVVEPHSSTPLSLSPLSSLLVPFSQDYLVYWGSLQTSRCAHTMMWLVSRAALAITVEDLNAFRSLLNSRKEPMNKNFRASNSPQGRMVFHVNPSEERKNLLLPGSINPPGQVVVINYSQMPLLNKNQAKQIFSQGDSSEPCEKMSESSKSEVNPVKKAPPSSCEGSERGDLKNRAKAKSDAYSSSERASSLKTDNSSSTRDNSPGFSKAIATKQVQLSKINYTEKPFKESKKYGENIFKTDTDNGSEQGTKRVKESDTTLCVHPRSSKTLISVADKKLNCVTETQKNKIVGGNDGVKQMMKSRLPVYTGTNSRALESSLAQYFRRPESAPGENSKRPVKTALRAADTRRAPAVTTIPRPIGINAGKLDSEPFQTRFTATRPTSSPNKFNKKPPHSPK